jgi:hypothetical protein
MAPWRHAECPVCRHRTRQWIAGPDNGPNGEAGVRLVCEECLTALLIDKSGIIDQREANDRERSLCPPQMSAAPDSSSESSLE